MLTQDQKTKIYNILAEVYIDLIKTDKIGKMERRMFAAKVLEHMNKAQTFDEVLVFVDEMIKIYPAMQIARVKLHDNINQVHEKEVMGKLQSFLKIAGTSN